MDGTSGATSVTRPWKPVADMTGRAILLLVGIFILLYFVYGPNTTRLQGAGDVWLYQDYAKKLLGTPPQLPREYPPLRRCYSSYHNYLHPENYMLGWVVWAALAMWLTMVTVDRVNGGGFWMFLLVALGAWGTAAFRFDIFIVLVTTLAFAAGTRSRWVFAQLLLALGVALKLYPLILMPVVVIWQWRTNAPLADQRCAGRRGGSAHRHRKHVGYSIPPNCGTVGLSWTTTVGGRIAGRQHRLAARPSAATRSISRLARSTCLPHLMPY